MFLALIFAAPLVLSVGSKGPPEQFLPLLLLLPLPGLCHPLPAGSAPRAALGIAFLCGSEIGGKAGILPVSLGGLPFSWVIPGQFWCSVGSEKPSLGCGIPSWVSREYFRPSLAPSPCRSWVWQGRGLGQRTPKGWILADCAGPGELPGEAQNAQTEPIPREKLQALPLLLEPRLEGHCHRWDTEKPPRAQGPGRGTDRPEGPAKQTPSARTVPEGLEMLLGTVQTMPEDLAPWGVASCSEGTFGDVRVSPRVRTALAAIQAAQIPHRQEGRSRKR